MTFIEVATLIFTVLAIGIAIWAGDSLLSLLIANGKIKQGVRIVAIAALSLWFLAQVAAFLGVPTPWSSATHHRR